jgi:hypothetical protein
METTREQSQLQKSGKHEPTTIRNARLTNKGTIMLWIIQMNDGYHVRFQPQITLQNRKCHISIKFYHVKDFFFLKLKINMVDSF